MRKSDLVFFLTGCAALVYETIWARLLTRILGSQASATAIILAIFMAGLGLGALLFSRLAARTPRPAHTFAALECFIGLWAVLSPMILVLIDPVEGLTGRSLVAALILLPPTFAMGATFPLMGRLTITEVDQTGSETSRFYGANTLGACFGVLLGTGVLMPLLGLQKALWASAVLNVAASALALTLNVPAQAGGAGSTAAESRAVPGGRLDPFLVVPLLFGLSSLALEVLLTRLLVTVTGASIYAFAIVLSVYLFGIGLGSRQAKELLSRDRDAGRLLATCALAVPALALLGALALRWQLGEPDLFSSLANRMPGGTGTFRLWLSHTLFAALSLLPPAVAFGMALPAAVQVAAGRAPGVSVETTLGRVYAANTLGALLGALGAGFLLLPWLGLRLGFAVALAPCLLAALLVPRRPAARLLAGTVAAGLLGVLVLRPAARAGGADLLFHTAGLYEMIAVEESIEPDGTPVRSIRLNGKVEASTAAVDVRLQRLLGHIPGLLHGNVRKGLTIGTGTGMTAGSQLDLPGLESLTLYEIEPKIPEGTRWFADWNNDLLNDPRLTIRFGDGRHSLQRSRERFDLITADPLHVWSKGSSDLYTLEYYLSMAEHLAPGGYASQWIGLYELSTVDVKTVMSTWAAAFPHVAAYLTAYDLALVASNEPFTRDLSQVELPEAVARNLAPCGIYSGAELAALQVADDADFRAYCSDVPAMRDDLPILEFRAPFSFLGGYSTEVLAWCGRDEFVERLPPASRKRAREVRVLLGEFLEALPRGLSAAGAEYGRALLALPPSDGLD